MENGGKGAAVAFQRGAAECIERVSKIVAQISVVEAQGLNMLRKKAVWQTKMQECFLQGLKPSHILGDFWPDESRALITKLRPIEFLRGL